MKTTVQIQVEQRWLVCLEDDLKTVFIPTIRMKNSYKLDDLRCIHVFKIID